MTASAPTPSIAGLRTITLLAGVREDVLRNFSHRCAWRRFRTDQCIVSRDGKDSDVYFVVSGAVRVTAFSAGGRQLTYRDLAQGEWFGDLTAIDRQVRSADVMALSETFVASVHRDDFLQLLAQDRTAAEAQMKHLVQWVRALTDRLFDVSTLGVQHRVHAELLRLAREAGVTANVARIAAPPTHAELASRLSTYREQVSRELSQLAKIGVLQRTEGALLVCNVARLERMIADVRRTP